MEGIIVRLVSIWKVVLEVVAMEELLIPRVVALTLSQVNKTREEEEEEGVPVPVAPMGRMEDLES